jgi:hypothetical protein
MGLASKLQAAQVAMNTLAPMAGGMTMGGAGAPSAPPYPPAGGATYGAPGVQILCWVANCRVCMPPSLWCQCAHNNKYHALILLQTSVGA